MTKAKFASLLVSLILAVFTTVPARGDDAVSHAYVVLVGISQYNDKQIKPRPHAEDDAKALYDLFSNKDYLGVRPANMQLLLGNADAGRKSEPATHANIIKALHTVAGKADRDDLVIFAFIGQGGPINDKGNRLCYFATDTTLKDRSKNAVAAADIQQELDKLKSHRFCAFLDVNFHGYADGPEKLPEPVFGSGAYREFLGSDAKADPETSKEEQATAPGRVLFLASSGLRPSLDLEKHGVFAAVLLRGLKGGADKDGFEPDGAVTVDELGEYLEKELPDTVRKHAKTDEEKKQQARFYESRSSHFVVTRNPAVTARVKERLQKLATLAKDKKINEELASEGKKVLERMPKLKAYQDLRRSYQQLVDGKLTVEAFDKERKKIQDGMKLRRSAAFAYAAKVVQSTQIIRENYVKEVKQGDLVAWAIRGLYRQIDEKVPADVRSSLDKVNELTEAELTALLADTREKLGQREDLDSHKDIDISLQRMLAHLDPYTTYYDPETLARFRQETNAEFRGIGVQIRENRTKGGLEVVTPLKGSPAYEAGILAGDLITSVTRDEDAQGKKLPVPELIPTKGMSTNDAVKIIQGKAGTAVKLTIEREGADKPLEFEIKRRIIDVETVMGFRRNAKDDWDYMIDPVNKVCYVRVTTFARKTYRDLLTAVRKLNRQGINGFILDLRFNPGGLLTSAVEVSDLFIDDGLIVTIKPRVGKETPYIGEHEGSYLNFPMVCLVNNLSASGSEIVAACLQDHERAIIMGERSYGKGSVQNIQPFEGGELKFTTASYWRPSGKNINKSSTGGKEDEDWGVLPNPGFRIDLTDKERDQLYEHQHDAEIIPRKDLPSKEKKTDFKDRQLEMALEYLRGQIKTAAKTTVKRAG